MDSNLHPADPNTADMAVADEHDVSTARIFTVLCIASTLFWGGVGLLVLRAIT